MGGPDIVSTTTQPTTHHNKKYCLIVKICFDMTRLKFSVAASNSQGEENGKSIKVNSVVDDCKKKCANTLSSIEVELPANVKDFSNYCIIVSLSNRNTSWYPLKRVDSRRAQYVFDAPLDCLLLDSVKIGNIKHNDTDPNLVLVLVVDHCPLDEGAFPCIRECANMDWFSEEGWDKLPRDLQAHAKEGHENGRQPWFYANHWHTLEKSKQKHAAESITQTKSEEQVLCGAQREHKFREHGIPMIRALLGCLEEQPSWASNMTRKQWKCHVTHTLFSVNHHFRACIWETKHVNYWGTLLSKLVEFAEEPHLDIRNWMSDIFGYVPTKVTNPSDKIDVLFAPRDLVVFASLEEITQHADHILGKNDSVEPPANGVEPNIEPDNAVGTKTDNAVETETNTDIKTNTETDIKTNIKTKIDTDIETDDEGAFLRIRKCTNTDWFSGEGWDKLPKDLQAHAKEGHRNGRQPWFYANHWHTLEKSKQEYATESITQTKSEEQVLCGAQREHDFRTCGASTIQMLLSGMDEEKQPPWANSMTKKQWKCRVTHILFSVNHYFRACIWETHANYWGVSLSKLVEFAEEPHLDIRNWMSDIFGYVPTKVTNPSDKIDVLFAPKDLVVFTSLEEIAQHVNHVLGKDVTVESDNAAESENVAAADSTVEEPVSAVESDNAVESNNAAESDNAVIKTDDDDIVVVPENQ